MEFSEKLQKLRNEKSLTQEELAAKLFVSRTAISKWESGRGYPELESLKAIARFFHVTVDELICSEEMLTLAEEEKKKAGKKYAALVCGVLDCLSLLLLFLPVFGSKEAANSMSLLLLTGVSAWLVSCFFILAALSAILGLCELIALNLPFPKASKWSLSAGFAVSVLATALFILARQPYAGVYSFCLLLTKGVCIFQSR